MKKVFLIFVTSFLMFGCQYFEKNVPSKEELLQKELQKINWNEVDEFPTTLNCDSISDKELRKQCFFDFMKVELQSRLSNDTIRRMYKNQDTLLVKVVVSPNAEIAFESQFKLDSLPFDKVKADSVLQSKLIYFPAVEPAIKRGVKVKSEFIITVPLKK